MRKIFSFFSGSFLKNSFRFSEKSWIYGQKSQLYNVEFANVCELVFIIFIKLF